MQPAWKTIVTCKITVLVRHHGTEIPAGEKKKNLQRHAMLQTTNITHHLLLEFIMREMNKNLQKETALEKV